MSGHYVVCGAGRIGSNVLQELRSTGRESVVIEPSPDALEKMQQNYPRQLYLQGDGASDEMLVAAGIERAVGVFAVSGDDSKNLVITLSARQLNPRLRIVARCHDVGFVDKIRRVGADDIVSPDFTGALRIASRMLRPAVVSFLDEMLRTDQGLRVEEVAMPPMGTHELFIQRSDDTGGSGANFLISWKSDIPVSPPIVEGIHANLPAGRSIVFTTSARPVAP